MTTDPTPLRERIARAAATSEGFGPDHPDHEVVVGEYLPDAQFLAPIIAAEVRKAQADAWDEGWMERAKRDVYRSHPHLDRDVPGPPRHLNPHREQED